MDLQFSQLKESIMDIEDLKNCSRWGPEFQLWKNKIEKLVRKIFSEEEVNLFLNQKTKTFSYIDEGFNIRQYYKELDNRKKILEGLLEDKEEYIKQSSTKSKTEYNVLKKIWTNEHALKENLIEISEVQGLHEDLLSYLESVLTLGTIPYLRFKKIKAESPLSWWSNEAGYPIDNPWHKFQIFLDLLEQHEAEKTIKKRLETEGLFVESRCQGEDHHLLIGERDGTGEKAHIIIDGKNGEIRIEDNRQEPTELISRIETILTLPNGKKIRTTRELIEEIT